MAPLNIVLGCMTYGAEQKSRVSDVGTIQGIFDVFKRYGHNEMDTSRVYAAGTSEEILGKLAVQSKQGMKMATKCHPQAGGMPLQNVYPHTKEGLAKSMAESLQALQVGQVDIFLLHMPVRRVAIIQTAKIDGRIARYHTMRRVRQSMNCTSKESLLRYINLTELEGGEKAYHYKWGLSNYPAWEVAEIYMICKYKGYVLPTIYQGAFW